MCRKEFIINVDWQQERQSWEEAEVTSV